MKVLVAQLGQIHCDLMNCRPPSSSVYGILQARILEWVAILFSKGSSQHKDCTQVSHIASGFFTVLAKLVKNREYSLYIESFIYSLKKKNKTICEA